jgi:predicted dehydrogenase
MVRVAFVGSGGVQDVHCGNVASLENTRVVGHCDPVKDRAQYAAQRFGGDAYENYEALFDKGRPDAVYVSVPPFAHGAIETEAIDRGIHLFVEKPLGLCAQSAKGIDKAIRKEKLLAAVGHCFRYWDTVAQARQFLRGKAISLVNGYCICRMPAAEWWSQMDKSGGQFVEQSTQVVDLMRYLCGEVAEVYALGSTGCMTKMKEYDVHDSSVVSLRLKCGAAAVISSSCISGDEGRVGLEVITPEATVRLDGRGTLTIDEEGKTTQYRPSVDHYAEAAKAFIESVRSGKKTRLRSTYADALKTFLVTCAANESMVTGLPVKP